MDVVLACMLVIMCGLAIRIVRQSLGACLPRVGWLWAPLKANGDKIDCEKVISSDHELNGRKVGTYGSFGRIELVFNAIKICEGLKHTEIRWSAAHYRAAYTEAHEWNACLGVCMGTNILECGELITDLDQPLHMGLHQAKRSEQHFPVSVHTLSPLEWGTNEQTVLRPATNF